MEGFVKGDIIVISFPFSDLSSSKRRPALVLARLQGDDLILCQITSESRLDSYAIRLESSDFSKGKLNVVSMIRPNKLITIDKSLIQYKIGALKHEKLKEVIKRLIKIFEE